MIYRVVFFTFAALCGVAQTSNAADLRTQACTLPTASIQPSPTEWRILRENLETQLNRCLQNSDYFALYGSALMHTGELAQATEMLERALLLNPNNGAARIDYAQALYFNHELRSALQINSELLKETSLPDHLRLALEARQTRWEKMLHLWSSQISYVYGHSSNLNNATYIDRYNFIYNGVEFPQEVSKHDRANSGGYHYYRLNSQYYSLLEQGSSLLSLSARTRESNEDRTDTTQFQLGYEREHESLEQITHWSVTLEHLQDDLNTLYSASGNLKLSPKNSNFYIDFESRYVNFGKKKNLAEASIAFHPGLNFSFDYSQLGIELDLGKNYATHERAGGDRNIYGVSMHYDMITAGGKLSAQLSYKMTEDNDGYFLLLNQNASKTTKTWSAALQYLYPISNDLILHTGYYYRDQDSNIDLFKMRTENYDLGLTYRF